MFHRDVHVRWQEQAVLSVCLSLSVCFSITICIYILQRIIKESWGGKCNKKATQLSFFLSFFLSCFLSFYLFVRPSVCLSIYMFVCLFVCLFICLSVYIAFFLSFFLSFFHLFICPFIRPFICPIMFLWSIQGQMYEVLISTQCSLTSSQCLWRSPKRPSWSNMCGSVFLVVGGQEEG